METIHLTNHPLEWRSPTTRILLAFIVAGMLFLFLFAPGWQQLILSLFALACLLGFGYLLIITSIVRFTLTATHFQQHLFKGGWVVKWINISKIGLCYYDNDGWQQPMPWIGIKLKHYSPYITSICPRIATDVLLSQRALLYLGAKQVKQTTHFEDIVLDSSPYVNSQGNEFSGLHAMLANRMRYQRQYYDYDVFISTNDLDRPAEEFVGLARRYLAAAKSEEDERI
ncbi:DUF2982 domain-containing protein [Vibrio sp. TRT 17S01]|uniref:DUF2982 domain-containing protein n=1 Tax=Vibrio sp. TRT 17S01 TaxID=3418505 RepID=UPI003CF8E236